MSQVLCNLKDQQRLLMIPAVYIIPSADCPKVYINMTNRSVPSAQGTRKKFHLKQPERSASDHALKEEHTIGLDDTTVLARASGFYLIP